MQVNYVNRINDGLPNDLIYCNDFDGDSIQVCFPTKIDCDLNRAGCGILVDCLERWNCVYQECKGRQYGINFYEDDTFDIQLKMKDFANEDVTNPILGWGNGFYAEVHYGDGTPISIDHTLFASEYMVGWNGTNSYQIIRLDFSLPFWDDKHCFYIRFYALNGEEAEVGEICTQEFQRITDCDRTEVIELVSTGFDCCNNYYGEPTGSWVGSSLISYSPKLRLDAIFKSVTGGSMAKTEVGNKVSTKTIINRWRLILLKPVPPFIDAYILNQFIAADYIVIDSRQFRISNYTQSNAYFNNSMRIFNIDVNEECTPESCII